MSVYVGIDVHRKRSQVAVVTGDGTVELNKNVVNGSEPMLRLIGDLPPGTPVAFEAAFGWGWLAALLEDYGFEAHLVHPLRCKAIASARLKNDKVDAATLAQLLRADLLPEAWIAPPAVRQLRALLRHRAGLVRLGTQQRNRIHAVVADFGFDRSGSYLSGPGRGWLAGLELPAYAPDLNPAERIWTTLKRSIANFAAADQAGLVRIIKRKLKKIQYRPHLIDGCLAATGLNIESW